MRLLNVQLLVTLVTNFFYFSMIKGREVKKIEKELVTSATNSRTFNRHIADIHAQHSIKVMLRVIQSRHFFISKLYIVHD